MDHSLSTSRADRNPFVMKHQNALHGVLSCFDRLVFKGHLPICWPEAMERFLTQRKVLLKDFKKFAINQSEALKEHARRMADEAGRPYLRPANSARKEEVARGIAERDGVTEGLVCVLAAQEQCQSFRLAYGKGRPRLVNASPRCLCLYYYFIEPDLGLIHVRIQTWLPYVVQVYVNGHEWLAKALDKEGIGYTQVENAFVWIEDMARAQVLANRFARSSLHKRLSRLAGRVNPHLQSLLEGLSYYWVTEQAEFATDIVFRTPSKLRCLYERLLEHAIRCFGPESVMTFLGRKLNGRFQGELQSTMNTRHPGERIKHRMKRNWIKMYSKDGVVLRIETVINHPSEFRVWRKGKRKGQLIEGWFPMAKRISNLGRYAEVSLASNLRYMEALSVVDDPATAYDLIERLAKPVRRGARRHRALNPLSKEDLELFAAVARGENFLRGFRNGELREAMGLRRPYTVKERRRLSARIGRRVQLLRAHGLVARIPRTRRYRPTLKGITVIAAVLTLVRRDLVKQLDTSQLVEHLMAA